MVIQTARSEKDNGVGGERRNAGLERVRKRERGMEVEGETNMRTKTHKSCRRDVDYEGDLD